MWVVSLVMLVIFPFGVPAALGWTLWRKRHVLYPRNKGSVMSVSPGVVGEQPSVLSVWLDKVTPEMQRALHGRVGSTHVSHCSTSVLCCLPLGPVVALGPLRARNVCLALNIRCCLQVQALGSMLATGSVGAPTGVRSEGCARDPAGSSDPTLTMEGHQDTLPLMNPGPTGAAAVSLVPALPDEILRASGAEWAKSPTPGGGSSLTMGTRRGGEWVSLAGPGALGVFEDAGPGTVIHYVSENGWQGYGPW
jgi:hypothetical protein